MGLSVSRSSRQKPKGSDKLHKSSEDVYDVCSRSSNSLRSSTINFQDRLWSKQSKQRASKRDIDDDIKCHETQLYATLQADVLSKTDPEHTNTTSNANYYGGDWKTSSKPIPLSRSSISSVCANLPQLPAHDQAEKKKLNRKDCSEAVDYSAVMGKDRYDDYTMTTCIGRPDPSHSTNDYTVLYQNSTSGDPATDGEATREEGCTTDGKNGCSDEIVPREATVQSGDFGTHEEEAYHGIVSRDPGCDAVTRDISMLEKNPADCDYEIWPGGYNHRRATSYKQGKLFMNQTPRVASHRVTPVTNFPSSRQPSKPLVAISNVPQRHPLQPLQPPNVQPSQTPPVQPFQTPTIQPNFILNHQTNADFDVYRVSAGSQQRLPHITVSVPPRVVFGLPFIELRWSYNREEFPVLATGQRLLTNVLHCLPHGLTFTSPVVISIDLPLTEGQIEIFYNPTDVGQTPIWTKLKAIDTPANTRFTDDRQPFANKVLLLLKNSRKAVLTLRHFCSFAVVESTNVVLPRKAEVAIFLKTEKSGQDSWTAIFQVAVGSDKNNMHRRFQALKDDGFRMIEKTGVLLYRTESDSGLEVGIRDIEWVGGCMQKQSNTSMIHGLDCLWSGIEATSLFWMKSKGSKPNEEQLSCIVYVRQEGRLEKPIGIYCELAKEQRMTPRSRRPIEAACSSPALLASINLRTESDARNPTSDSDLSLVTEDLSSRRHDDEVTDSDRDFELNYYASGKAVIHEAASNSKLSSKRFHSVENLKNTGICQNGQVSSLAKSLTHLVYSAEDINRITTTVGGTVITQPELDWMLAA